MLFMYFPVMCGEADALPSGLEMVDKTRFLWMKTKKFT